MIRIVNFIGRRSATMKFNVFCMKEDLLCIRCSVLKTVVVHFMARTYKGRYMDDPSGTGYDV